MNKFLPSVAKEKPRNLIIAGGVPPKWDIGKPLVCVMAPIQERTDL
jgi:hypothetical protein